MKLLNAYLWGYKNWEAAYHSIRKFKQFYPDGNVFIKVDNTGDFTNYNRVAKEWGAECSENPFQIGYPGNHNQYNVGRDCWSKECTILWLDNIYDACKKSNSKFLIILEEDTFILKPLSILNQEFGISIFEVNTNTIPEVLLDMVRQLNGNTNIPTGLMGRGYGAGGGFIVDCQKWIKSWEYFKPILELNYDMLANQSKLIGWSDCVAQLVIMVGGYEVLTNFNCVQTWFENSNLYPNCKSWRDAEIVDYLKNIEEIRKL